MEKFKYFFNKLVRNYIFKIIFTLILGIGLLMLLRYVAFKEKAEIFAWCNSLFITFGVLFGIGVLSLLSSFGAFDLIGYSFANIFSVIINKDEKKYVDAIDYRDKRVEKNRKTRWSFFVYLGISLLFLIAELAIYIYIRYTYNY